ncbi:MAG: NTP transferase domain-containing protein [Candidatus Diapherotrites archaeon]|nr:NTP transferase domain-containing protein [Candidatus Diapherotrites archaeon]
MKAVVLAGGKGVRLRPYTETLPKAMIKLGSKPLLQRILENTKQAGIKEAMLIVGYKKESIEDFFREEFKGIKLSYFVQRQQLGTAHALSLVEEFVDGNFLAINGDVLVESTVLEELAKEDEFDLFDTLIAAREVSDPWRYGCLLTSGNKVKDIIEKPSPGQEPSNLVNAGVYRFSQNIFGAIKKTDLSKRGEFELVDSIKILIKSGVLVGYRNYTGRCSELGDQSDLEKLQKIIKD